MCIKTIYYVVQEIDNQISKLKLQQTARPVFEMLINLRNGLILKIINDKKSEEHNEYFWEIVIPKAKKAVKYFNWQVAFVEKL